MTFWTDEKISLLTRLWMLRGATSRQIGHELGCSAAAVCCKVIRMGLPRRGKNHAGLISPTFPQESYIADRSPRSPSTPIELPQEIAGVPVGKTIVDVKDDECRYPISRDGEPFLCCGIPTGGGSWCEYHRPIVWIRPERKEKTKISAFQLRSRI